MPYPKGKKHSSEHKEKIRQSMIGKNTWMKGRKMSTETLEKKSVSAKISGVGKWMKGRKLSESTKHKISEYQKTHSNLGRFKKGMIVSLERRKFLHELMKGKNPFIKFPPNNKGRKRTDKFKKDCSERLLGKTGPLSRKWIMDRSKLKRFNDDQKDRRSSAYVTWRRSVWLRDNFKCKIANPDCEGRIEAHHILSWTQYPDLRYQLNNGITLCHAHHPRKRAEEKRLSPYFQELVSVSRE